MPKSYSQYKYQDIETLGLKIQQTSFVSNVKPLEPTDFLRGLLAVNTKRVQRTEKAKSEFIIAPILYEIALNNEHTISFFSGYNFDVDKSLGLKGFCDFLFAKIPNSPFIKAPVFCIAEAKNDNLETGIAQCIAEMYAAKLFNEKHNCFIENIYGCVTTGYIWQFLKLENTVVLQDETIYALSDLPKILGILQYIVEK
jgi:hypothetical protein